VIFVLLVLVLKTGCACVAYSWLLQKVSSLGWLLVVVLACCEIIDV